MQTQATKTRAITTTEDTSSTSTPTRDAETQALIDKADEWIEELDEVVEETVDQIDHVDEVQSRYEVEELMEASALVIKELTGREADVWDQIIAKLKISNNPCGCAGFALFLGFGE